MKTARFREPLSANCQLYLVNDLLLDDANGVVLGFQDVGALADAWLEGSVAIESVAL